MIEREQTLQKFQTVKMEYMNNSKIANFIATHEDLIDVNVELKTMPRKNIMVAVNLYAEEELKLSNPNITLYDMAVMDAAYTLYINGINEFTAGMIVRVMSGNMSQDVTKQKAGEVIRSLDKLKYIRIRIDCTADMIARKEIKKGESYVKESYLMPLNEVEVKVGNQKIMKGYSFAMEPVLYEYASTIGQIINVPRTILETKAALRDTDDVVVIKRYLIKRIEVMKNSNNTAQGRRITYDWYDVKTKESKGMFQALGYKPEKYSNWAKRKSNIHRDVKAILGVFVEKKYIKSFKEYKEGKAIKGIDIIL